MPSYPSDVPSTGQQLQNSGSSAPWIGLGLSAAGMVLSHIENKRKRKRLGKLRAEMLNEIDSGASDARGAVGREARTAQSGAYQGAVNRGFANSSVASDASTNISLEAGTRFGDISARAGRERAQVLADTFDQGGGPDLSGVGRIGGLILSSRLNQNNTSTLNASRVAQDAGRVPAMQQTGGDPATDSSLFDGQYEGGGASLGASSNPEIDQMVQRRMRRRPWAFG